MNFQHHILFLEASMMQNDWSRSDIEFFIDEFNEIIDKISLTVLLSALEEAISFAESNQYYLLMDKLVVQDYSIVLMNGGADFGIQKSHNYVDPSKTGQYIIVPTKPKKTGFNDMAKKLKESRMPQSLKEGSIRAPHDFLTKQLSNQSKQIQESATKDPDSGYKAMSIDEQIHQEQEIFVYLQQLNLRIEQDIHSQIKDVLDDAIRRIKMKG